MKETKDLEKIIITKCCECDLVRIDDKWLEAYIPKSANVLYSHGYCPVHYLEAMRKLEGDYE